ncbi:RNA polymerase sigma factor [Amycolatopsis sp. NPDC049252]|uniref:RNA polymerase sigma factor n=1 Tax=Amycolatopsis sp. NPDC049252 TaxID=3363933 RepID=UPI003713B060
MGTSHAHSSSTTDADLVHAAQAGDVSALGSLLIRHRPSLLAFAISLIGYGPDAEDAVQEACLIALRRLGELRDPAAAGSWLRTVVRNVCRMRYRARTDQPLDDGLAATLRSSEPDPTELVWQHATRDWVWHALADLSPPLRLVVMLRHFSSVTSYQDIADVCGVPVGTVRSRLHEARGKLSQALLATADAAHGDVRVVTGEWRRYSQDMVSAVYRGDVAAQLAVSWTPTVDIRGPHDLRNEGYGALVRGLEQDMLDGVGYRVTNVAASRDIVVCEFELRSPPEDPLHCPPGAAWVLHVRAGWVEQARLFQLRRQPVETA